MNAESLNRLGLTEAAIEEHLSSLCSDLINKGRRPLTLAFTAQALKTTLPQVAGRIPDEAFGVLVGLCASLMCAAAIEMVDERSYPEAP